MEVGQLQFKFSLPLQNHPFLSSSPPPNTHTLPATTHHTATFQPLAHSCNQSLDLWTQTKPNKQTNHNFFQGLSQRLKSGGGTVWPKTLANQSFDWYVRLGLQDLYGIPLMLINYQPLLWMSDETLIRVKAFLHMYVSKAEISVRWKRLRHKDLPWCKWIENWYTAQNISRLDCVQCLLVW